MKLIKPTAEIWEQGDTLEDMWKHIAKCTRVCYQSTPKNNGETDEEFVKRVILRHEPWSSEANHLAMLEHGTIYLNCPNITYCNRLGDKYTQHVYDEENHQFCITTNLRVLIETNNLDLLSKSVLPTIHKRRVTVSFTTNIGVSREFNRHRINSIAEESTRYCNYSKDRFGKSITFCRPAWISEEELSVYTEQTMRGIFDESIEDKNLRAIHYYNNCLFECQRAYNMLISLGWTPQQAREVLPLATKTQLIHTAFVDDWKHFFALRADGVSGPPHPNAKLIAEPLKQEFIKRGYI